MARTPGDKERTPTQLDGNSLISEKPKLKQNKVLKHLYNYS